MVQAALWSRHLRPEVGAEDASFHGHPGAHQEEVCQPQPLQCLKPTCRGQSPHCSPCQAATGPSGSGPIQGLRKGWAGVSLTRWMPWHPGPVLCFHAQSLCVLSPRLCPVGLTGAGPKPGEARSGLCPQHRGSLPASSGRPRAGTVPGSADATRVPGAGAP